MDSELRWLVAFGGIADAYLYGFDCDGWKLRHGSPAMGLLGIYHEPGQPPPTIDDAAWLSDCIAYDHDAPVGIHPARSPGQWFEFRPKDEAATVPIQPIVRLERNVAGWYWHSVREALEAAASLRFGPADSYAVRYETGDPDTPSTNFRRRFRGRESLLAIYAMATRQTDFLSEFLVLYRVLEGADGTNGMDFVQDNVGRISEHEFGVLRVHQTLTEWVNAFGVVKERACTEINALQSEGKSIARHLYKTRNAIAHGKTNVLAGGYGPAIDSVARSLPIVKLLARLAIEGPRR